MKNLSILDQIETLHYLVSLENDKNILEEFVIFDANNNLYYGALKEDKTKSEKVYYGASGIDSLYKTYFYSMKNIIEKNKNQAVAELFFVIKNNKSKSLSRTKKMNVKIVHTIDQKMSGKGIGHQLLGLVDYIAMKNDIDKINLRAHAFHYAKNEDRLLKFYESAGYLPYEKTDLGTKTEKEMLTSEVDNIKTKIINFPILSKNYTVLLPQKMIVHSAYKDKEKTLE